MINENNKNKPTKFGAESLDGVIAAPDHHRIVFENERLRIIEFRVPPGEIVPLHTHRFPSINYVLSLSDFLSFDAHGNIKLDSRSGHSDIKQGEVFCLPPFPPPHSVENIGRDVMHAVSVELKD
jgi:quercetin dioxygenase-like cupin family protein